MQNFMKNYLNRPSLRSQPAAEAQLSGSTSHSAIKPTGMLPVEYQLFPPLARLLCYGSRKARRRAQYETKGTTMKLAIPSETGEGLTSIRSGHFGHTPWFTIVTIENDQVANVEAVKNIDHDEVGCGGVIEFAAGLGIDAIMTAGMGRPPFMRFSQLGVKVYLEQQTPIVSDAVKRFIAGDVALMSLDNACNHH